MSELVFDSMFPADRKRSLEYLFWNIADQSDQIDIAVGYVDAGSLAQLGEYVRQNDGFGLNLLVGMQYFEGFSRPQIAGLKDLAEILVESGRGNVYVTTNVRYHGKLYSFSNGGLVEKAYIGSGNLSAIGTDEKSNFELGIVVDDPDLLSGIEEYRAVKLFPLATPISSVELVPRVIPDSPLAAMDDVDEAPSGTLERLAQLEPEHVFRLPLKPTPKSNLNVFFGAPRRNFNTKRDIPRPWYEVELIVPKAITSLAGYPRQNSSFNVVTDDGFTFKCKVSGDFSKNLRSTPSLSILGGFLKGRLESFGCLNPGDLVTEDVLYDYGRDHVDLKYFREVDTWMLDFSTDEEGY